MDVKDLIKRDFLKGKLSRRDVTAALVNAGLGAAAAGAFVEQTLSEARAQEPKRGGRLRVVGGDSHAGETIDPAHVTGGVEIMRSGLLYGRLIDFFPDRGLTPALAESWESNDDATEWRFALRKGVEFHNAKTMTSADVAYSFNRLRDPEVASPAGAYMADIDEIKGDGPDTLVITMKSPNADIPFLLSEYHFVVTPEGATNFPQDAIGTNPWKVKEFEPGINAVFERHPNYWKTGLPYIDEIETFGIGDNQAQLNALLANEVDVISSVEAKLVPAIEASGEHQILTIAGGAHVTYPMRGDLAPYDNVDVRKALKAAIDRERFVQLAFDGLGLPARDHVVPEFDPMFCESIPVPKPDPDKVKFHLKRAGHESTYFELSAADSNFGGYNASVVLTELMKENGVNCGVKRVPADAYWSATWMKDPWCGSSWYGRPTANMMMSVAYIGGAPWNESFWRNDRFDKLIVEVRGVTDQAKRKEMYCELQQLMVDDCPSIIPAFTNWIDGLSAKVKNMKPHPFFFLGSMYWDEVWLDA